MPQIQPHPKASKAVAYDRHQPEQTVLYQLIQEHYPFLVSVLEANGEHLPSLGCQAFEEYFKFDLPQHSFLSMKCDGCRNEYFLAFSCNAEASVPVAGQGGWWSRQLIWSTTCCLRWQSRSRAISRE